jgi:RimJ/RimL family protein N-acetyltransferase
VTSRIVLPAGPFVDGPTALRPWRDSDLQSIVAACQDPDIPRWTRVPQPYGENDARLYLLHRYDGLEAGTIAPLAIVAAPDGELLGSISLMEIDAAQGRAEVGYWLAAEARGLGHATRAVRLICAWGFEALRLGRIGLLVDPRNGASRRVAERSGFTREALLRSHTAGTFGRQDMLVYSLLRDELPPVRGGGR